MRISIAIPYHGDRFKWTLQTISNLHNQKDVCEIVICCEPGSKENTRQINRLINYKKCRFIINETRLYAFHNKIKAVKNCKEDWVMLLDSDNVFGQAYMTAIKNIEETLNKDVIYCPEHGIPSLSYSDFIGMDINIGKANSMFGMNSFDMLINTGNYFFNRKRFIDALEQEEKKEFEYRTMDAAWINALCLKSGMIMRIVPGMNYYHNVHRESTYLINRKRGIDESDYIKSKMIEFENKPPSIERDIEVLKNISAVGGPRDIVKNNKIKNTEMLSD
jgi:hypothetical protein